jgi:hypothetical protein
MPTQIWTTQYPGALDTETEQPPVSNVSDIIDASHVNTLSEAVRALEVQVGSDLLEPGSIRDNVDTLASGLSILEDSNELRTSLEDGVIAYSGGGQADATLLPSGFNVVTVCDAHLDSVLLTDVAVGEIVSVLNEGDYDCAVFPETGHEIDDLGVNNAYYLASGSLQRFLRRSPTQWTRLNRSQRYVSRGDPGAWDFTHADVLSTRNGSWNDLDLTSIIPPSSYGKPVQLVMRIVHSSYVNFSLRTDGHSNAFNVLLVSFVANGVSVYRRGQVNSSGSGIIEYSISSAAGEQQAVVAGWWVEG